MAKFNEVADRIIGNVERVIIGKRPQVETALAAILAGGHVLLEDVPGVAKTMLARSLAVSMGCVFKRVQCTPDLLPTDVTGVSVFNQKTREFEFMPGPAFTNVLLADEINRATPRTQSALLEAMEEKQISVDGRTWKLPDPFVVLATQNPVEQEGTFPLPEAQLDRFLVRITLGYPAFDQETEMLLRMHTGHPLDSLKPVVDAKALTQLRDHARAVFVHKEVARYILAIVHETRGSVQLHLGASPRASIGLYRAAQAMAALRGRGFVTPDDVKALAVPVLAHRLILKPEHRLRKQTAAGVVVEILNALRVPTNVHMAGKDNAAKGDIDASQPVSAAGAAAVAGAGAGAGEWGADENGLPEPEPISVLDAPHPIRVPDSLSEIPSALPGQHGFEKYEAEITHDSPFIRFELPDDDTGEKPGE